MLLTDMQRCVDGEKNGDETDVDCGGTCTACAGSKACLSNTDCASESCMRSKCQPGYLGVDTSNRLVERATLEEGEGCLLCQAEQMMRFGYCTCQFVALFVES